jgi:hemerythrin-like domain-containing protein
MSKSTKILSDEHKNILKVVDLLEKECDSLNQKPIDRDFFEKVIDFIRNYADKFHHAKEENILFKEFCKSAENGELHCNPVDQMLMEHDMGREFVKGMEIGLNKNDKEELGRNAKGYIGLIREHIFKEDNILYPMADESLSKSVQDSMEKEFKKIEEQNKRKYSIRGLKI